MSDDRAPLRETAGTDTWGLVVAMPFKVLTPHADIRREHAPMSVDQKSDVEPARAIEGVVRTMSSGRGRPTPEPTARERMARNLARMMGRIDETALDPARAAQVEILRNAVASGRYRPDLREVAWKLLCEVAASRRY